jgi:transglutaminase-like putative cysteine protease
MRMVAEPEATARKLDAVEVFALTRVVLPKPLPGDVRRVPNVVNWVVTGLPDSFMHDDYRQTFKRLDKERVSVSVKAAPPVRKKAYRFPLQDPAGGTNLKDSLVMNLDDPDIKAAAKLAVGDEKDAYEAAKKVVAWVGSHMTKDYGSSSDRASEALRQLKGDCTEHSLLAVSMLRSLGIPAKRIDGLIYMMNGDSVPALYWHEWVEAYVGAWTQLDPTWDEPVTDATHLALGEETHEDIVQLIGQLKVVDAH